MNEGSTWEAKKASGKDGKGELPQSFFETYSAMANTDGGRVMLGIQEKNGHFTVTGIQSTGPVLKSLWDQLNNHEKVSCNLLSNKHVKVIKFGKLDVISIDVPRASRSNRPVYLGKNPMTGTYRRNHEGDYLCEAETVKRMLAEQVEQGRDGELLHGYNLSDVHTETLRSYRQMFNQTRADHPWTTQSDIDFLRSIGGWTADRTNGDDGLTRAGLLMFGKMSSILEAVPHYVVDYREIPDPRSDQRWTDRLTTDGSWSGNLFDFYRLTIAKLTSSLKVPFVLDRNNRRDQTGVHEALREALVNTLIHADYSDRVSVLIVKRPDLFGFRNPGVMRLPVEVALRGGNSDCRNRNLQKMFQLAGLAEQAGSGIPKIWRNWDSQHYRKPSLKERVDPDQTILSLRTVSLLPESALAELDRRFGAQWRTLSEIQRLALSTVCVEGVVDHSRLKSITAEHSSDITKALSGLVRDGFLESSGVTRSTSYCFIGNTNKMELLDDFDILKSFFANSEQIAANSEQMAPNSEQMAASSEQIQLAPEAVLLADNLAEQVKNRSKVSQQTMKSAILEICKVDYVTLKELAEKLGRSPDTLRVHYLNEMVKTGELNYKYSESPNHPGQAYKTQQ